MMIQSQVSVVEVIYSLGIGGSELLGRDLAVGLQQKGLRCAVCAVAKGGALASELADAGIPTFVAGRERAGAVATMVGFYRFFRTFRPDVVHTHHFTELYFSLLGAKLVGARIIHTEHEFFSLQGRKSAYLRVLAPFCDTITTVGDEVTEFLHQQVGIPRARLKTIRNGIPLDTFTGTVGPEKQDLGIAGDDIVIGTVARLERIKGHSFLIRVFADLLPQEPRLRLLLVGEGSLRTQLEREVGDLGISSRVLFLGARRDVPHLLSLMDLFVLPSLEEGVPLSLLEAMAAGKGVVATAVGGIPGIIRDGENGFLVPPGDESALRAALAGLLGDRQRAAAVGAEARATVQEAFDFSETLEAYCRLMQPRR